MTNGIFKRIDTLGCVRGADLMSTKSSADFEWCVKLMQSYFNVGIASKYTISESKISDHDENAVFICSRDTLKIKIGSETIYSNVTMKYPDNVIRFRFRPEQKKLDINLVSEQSLFNKHSLYHHFFNLFSARTLRN